MIDFLKSKNTGKKNSQVTNSMENSEKIDGIHCKEVFCLTDEIEKNINKLLKQEGSMTYGLETLHESTEYTTAQIQKVKEYLNVLSKSSDNISDLMDDALGSVQASLQEVDNSKKCMNNLSEHMNYVSTAFEQISSSFNLLKSEYDNISQFANIITSVANQTNMLSLNASIEAARVGDSGKGFAVVANEIKNLSLNTQNSVKDILEALKKMTDIIELINKNSIEGTKVVGSTNELIEASSNQLEKIVHTENIVNECMNQVKSSQSESQSKIQEITDDLTNVVGKAIKENNNLDELIFNVQIKADYYQYILNHLNQIKILGEK